MHVPLMRDFFVSDQRTDGQADSGSWMLMILHIESTVFGLGFCRLTLIATLATFL